MVAAPGGRVREDEVIRPGGAARVNRPVEHVEVTFVRRLETKRLPADDIIDSYNRERSMPAVLRHLAFALC